jgi:hypothetical protein
VFPHPLTVAGLAAVFPLVLFEGLACDGSSVSGVIRKRSDTFVFFLGNFAADRGHFVD